MYKNIKLTIFCFVLLFSFPFNVFAHSGRTDSSGCHTNRKTGDYHCHGAPATIETKEARTESRQTANEQARIDAPSLRPISSETIQTTFSEEKFLVSRVIDGDTIDVVINGVTQRVRLIGIDTPETVDPRKPVQCFGIEASNRAKEKLNGERVKLEADPTQGDVDKYARLLRYVFLENGANFNQMMIEEGYAHEYTYNAPYKYQKEFKEAESYARDKKKGLWADDACKNIITSSTTSSTVLSSMLNSKCNCTGNVYNCDDFLTHAEAQALYECCGGINNDVHRLDSDKNGSACEMLP